MVTQTKVAICIPSGDEVKTEFAFSLAYLSMEALRIGLDGLHHFSYRSSALVESRRRLASEALSWGATHILFLDSDMCFAPWLLRRLMNCDKDIIAANAAMRNHFSPPRPAGGEIYKPDGTISHRVYGTDGNEPIAVDTVGFGAVLIRREVFERMEKPWFMFTYRGEPGSDTNEFRASAYTSEDYHFCVQAKKAGFSIWIDPVSTRHMGHVGGHVYGFHKDATTGAPLEGHKFSDMIWNSRA